MEHLKLLLVGMIYVESANAFNEGLNVSIYDIAETALDFEIESTALNWREGLMKKNRTTQLPKKFDPKKVATDLQVDSHKEWEKLWKQEEAFRDSEN